MGPDWGVHAPPGPPQSASNETWRRRLAVLSLVVILGASACRQGPSVTTEAEAEPLPRVDVAPDPGSAISTARTTDITEATTTSKSAPPSSIDTSGTATSTERNGDPSTTASTATASSPTSPSTQAGAADDLAVDSVTFVNQRRADNGLPSLQVDPALVSMADGWARQMASDGQLRHNPGLRDQAPARYRSVGENVAYSSRPGRIDGMWWDSNGHRANILSASYSALGVAFVPDERGIYWAVQVFAG